MNIGRLESKLKMYDKNLFLSSASKENFSFVRKGITVARIYKQGDKWFIWYECAKTRVPVENFTQAVNKLEKEFKCEE